MSGPLIRTMTDEDRERVIELLWELNRFEDTISHDRATRHADALACFNQSSKRLAEAPGGAMLVAEVGAHVVGYACVIFDDGSPFVRQDIRKHGYIIELVVAEAHRRRGIGRALIAECETITRQAGLNVIGIGVLVGNDDAEKSYRTAGFRPHAIEMLKRLD